MELKTTLREGTKKYFKLSPKRYTFVIYAAMNLKLLSKIGCHIFSTFANSKQKPYSKPNVHYICPWILYFIM